MNIDKDLPERIAIQPECEADTHGDGRCWMNAADAEAFCDTHVDNCGPPHPWTSYVREDVFEEALLLISALAPAVAISDQSAGDLARAARGGASPDWGLANLAASKRRLALAALNAYRNAGRELPANLQGKGEPK